MQYILTEQEYRDLKKAEKKAQQDQADVIQNLCTRVANSELSYRSWEKNDEARPWRCILTEEQEHYCDECPVITVCPSKQKEFSQ